MKSLKPIVHPRTVVRDRLKVLGLFMGGCRYGFSRTKPDRGPSGGKTSVEMVYMEFPSRELQINRYQLGVPECIWSTYD